MYKNRELHLRFLIGLTFAVVVLAPLFLIVADLADIAKRLWQQQLDVARQELKEEIAAFRESLIPRNYVENLVKEGEVHLGLLAETIQQPVFARNQDAGLFTASTIAQLRDYYQEHAGLKPLVIVTFNTDFANVWSWFNTDYVELRNLADHHIRRFNTTIPIFVADTATFTPVFENNPDAYANYTKLCQTLSDLKGRDGASHQFFYDFIGDMAYRPPHYGRVYEMATTRFGSRRMFLYHLPVKSGELVYGGYFVAFASRDIAVAKILKSSLTSTRPQVKRSFGKTGAVAAKQADKQSRLTLSLPLPGELTGYNILSGFQQSLPERIYVELSISDLRKSYDAYLGNLAIGSRFAGLLTFAVAAYFMLFGFPAGFRLRLRMLAIIALTIFLPWTILGYFCLNLFDSVQGLVGHELRAGAGSAMYRLISYYHDQKLQLNLDFLKTKNRMIEHVGKTPEELMKLPAHNVVMPGNFFELFFFRADGTTRTFRSRDPNNNKTRQIDCNLAAKFLDQLGALDRNIPANRKYLEQGEYTAGFLNSLQLNYSEHNLMRLEAVETREWKKADELSRMLYALFPDPKLPGQPVTAIGKMTISNQGYVLLRPDRFAPEIYSQRMPWQQHDFLIGQRRLDDSILRWWPEYINSASELKRQIDLAALTRSSGSRLIQDGKKFRFVNRRYLNNQGVVFAGVSTASQDLKFELLLKLFPFVLLALALLCLFLFADLLAAMFITPVTGFREATSEIAAGNYQVTVKMPESDEFSLLADSFNRMAAGLAQRERMRRFVSENLYERIGLSEADNTRVSEVTLLASDIRGFTTLSEKHEPQQVVSLLNDYFTEMESAIKQSGGLIERFVGDAVVAVFYQDQSSGCEQRALAAALQMRARLAELNRQRSVAGLFCIENGIGIATGEAVSGIAGSKDGRQIFSVIGEVTRLAEKLESASRNVPARILICPKTAAALAMQADLADAAEHCGFSAFTPVSSEVADG